MCLPFVMRAYLRELVSACRPPALLVSHIRSCDRFVGSHLTARDKTHARARSAHIRETGRCRSITDAAYGISGPCCRSATANTTHLAWACSMGERVQDRTHWHPSGRQRPDPMKQLGPQLTQRGIESRVATIRLYRAMCGKSRIIEHYEHLLRNVVMNQLLSDRIAKDVSL